MENFAVKYQLFFWVIAVFVVDFVVFRHTLYVTECDVNERRDTVSWVRCELECLMCMYVVWCEFTVKRLLPGSVSQGYADINLRVSVDPAFRSQLGVRLYATSFYSAWRDEYWSRRKDADASWDVICRVRSVLSLTCITRVYCCTMYMIHQHVEK